MAERTEFVVKFPVFREQYIKENQKRIEEVFKQKGLSLEFNFTDGDVTVSTTNDTFDPYVIVKGRDYLRLLARGVSIEYSAKVFEDGTHYEIIPIWKYVYAKDVFTKRRKRLLGPDGETLKALEILTQTYIVVMGKTVAIVGKVFGVKRAVEVVVDCMKNIHPLHHIKKLMVLRELENNPKMSNEDWSTYLPEFKKNNQKKHKKVEKKKRSFQEELKNVFPESNEKSKVDLAIESGEYFMKESEKRQYRNHKLEEQKKVAAQRREEKFEKLATAPKEKSEKKDKEVVDTFKLIENIQKRENEKKRKRDVTDFVESKRRK